MCLPSTTRRVACHDANFLPANTDKKRNRTPASSSASASLDNAIPAPASSGRLEGAKGSSARGVTTIDIPLSSLQGFGNVVSVKSLLKQVIPTKPKPKTRIKPTTSSTSSTGAGDSSTLVQLNVAEQAKPGSGLHTAAGELGSGSREGEGAVLSSSSLFPSADADAGTGADPIALKEIKDVKEIPKEIPKDKDKKREQSVGRGMNSFARFLLDMEAKYTAQHTDVGYDTDMGTGSGS